MPGTVEAVPEEDKSKSLEILAHFRGEVINMKSIYVGFYESNTSAKYQVAVVTILKGSLFQLS